MKPKIGFRFLHKRVITWDTKEPALYVVTKLARGCVYYAPIYDLGLSSERRGCSEVCMYEEFYSKVCKEAA